jgi:nucleotide-binding universal stress UspA family protein
MLKDILAFVDTGEADEQFLKDALAFARFHDAHLSIAIMSAIPTPDYALAYAPPYIVLSDFLKASEEKQERVAKLVGRDGVEVRILSDDPAVLLDKAPVQARYADLILFGPADAYANQRLRRRLLENVALSSGRPVLVLPNSWQPRAFEHLVIGWNATSEATRAVVEARILAAPSARIEVVTVDADASTKGHGSDPGADIARNLSRHGYAVTVHALASEGRTQAEVLTDIARSQRAAFASSSSAASLMTFSKERTYRFSSVTESLAPRPLLRSAQDGGSRSTGAQNTEKGRLSLSVLDGWFWIRRQRFRRCDPRIRVPRQLQSSATNGWSRRTVSSRRSISASSRVPPDERTDQLQWA